MLAALPAAALMKLPAPVLPRLELGLLAGTPGLAALTLIVAALTSGLRTTGALAGLLMLPLAVPILIFGAGLTEPEGSAGALKLLAAASLLLVADRPVRRGRGDEGGAGLTSSRRRTQARSPASLPRPRLSPECD